MFDCRILFGLLKGRKLEKIAQHYKIKITSIESFKNEVICILNIQNYEIIVVNKI